MPKTAPVNGKQPEFVTMRGPLTVEAAESDKSLPQFRMVAYTGGTMRIAGFPHPVVVDLAGLDIPSQNLPIRLDHERRQGVGHTHRVIVEGGQLVAEGLISRDTSWARDVARSGANGFPWQASIGAAVVEAEMVPAGVSVKVNGQSFAGPIHVVRRAVLKEISFVDSGADTGTTARIAAQDKENHAMSDQEVTTTDTTTESSKASQAQDPQAEKYPQVEAKANEGTEAPSVPAPEPVSDSIQAMRAEVAAESKRIAAIRNLCANGHPDIEAKAIEDGWDATRTELEVLRASRPAAPAPGVISGRADTTPKVIEAAACLATNAFSDDQLVKDYGEQTLDAAHRYRNIGVAGVIRLAAFQTARALTDLALSQYRLAQQEGRLTDEQKTAILDAAQLTDDQVDAAVNAARQRLAT